MGASHNTDYVCGLDIRNGNVPEQMTKCLNNQEGSDHSKHLLTSTVVRQSRKDKLKSSLVSTTDDRSIRHIHWLTQLHTALLCILIGVLIGRFSQVNSLATSLPKATGEPTWSEILGNAFVDTVNTYSNEVWAPPPLANRTHTDHYFSGMESSSIFKNPEGIGTYRDIM